jgi:hypothetical protein
MKNILLLFLLITASLLSKGQVVVTLNFPDPCSCDNSVLSDLLNVWHVSLPEATDTCFNATQTIVVGEVGAPFVMQPGAAAEMIAGERIIFKPSTTIKAGSYLHAYIAPDGPFCGDQSEPLPDNSKMAVTTGADEASQQEVQFKIYPNPTTGRLKIELAGVDQSARPLLEVFDLTGNKLKMVRMDNASRHTMNLSGLPSGMYIVSLTSGEFKKVERIIKF